MSYYIYALKYAKVAILGLTFKENCNDTRNSKVEDIINRLKEYGINPLVVDPWASERDAMKEYGVTLSSLSDIKDMDCIIVAVAHNEFRALTLEEISKMYKDVDNSQKVLIDVKGLYSIKELREYGLKFWRL